MNQTIASPNKRKSINNYWLRGLELTATIARNFDRLLPDVIDECACEFADAPALLSDAGSLTHLQLAALSHKYAHWALEQGIEKGDVVALLMTNHPEYFAAWVGITSIGGVVALLNTNILGTSLAHCINVVDPSHIVVSGDLAAQLKVALSDITVSPVLWSRGLEIAGFQDLDADLQRYSEEKPGVDRRPSLTVEDCALYIFTSGTTGMPKAAKISHARILQWCYWFAGMMDAQPSDRIYNCLPMYHSIGGVLVLGAALVSGASVVIREKFSVKEFWSDVVRWDCTILQYIGEFCRYLLNAAPSSRDTDHRIRLACGNGLAPNVWEQFEQRFQIPRILEFYASTEGGVSLFNVEGKRGAIGRVPPYLAHRFSPALVRFDIEKNEPARDLNGFCIPCELNEPGEAIGKALTDPSNVGIRYEGYTDKNASNKKILHNVFQPDDAWVRTGDLMRKDEKGFFYFVDRVGDTFRWKGENVATTEVAEAISLYPGVKHANVYGVSIPGTEGRAGMASLVVDSSLELDMLKNHVAAILPSYACPLFYRLQDAIEVTGTFKYSKAEMVRQGYDPATTVDTIYFDNPESRMLDRLDDALYSRIQSGQIRL
jgi:fatty-acyl-CoA synthase